MDDLWLIGIGTGSPRHLTLEGQDALRQAATILVPRKGTGKDDLADLRLHLIDSVGSNAEVLSFDMPVRDETLPYKTRVEHWHDAIAQRWTATLHRRERQGPVALLVWGDPGLYDSTLRIAARLTPRPRLRVIPGITALQALTSAHGIAFNTINGSFMVTTGRALRDHGWPTGAETVIVMLDGQCSFQSLDPTGIDIWWGGFLGMAEQVLVAGPLAQVTNQIVTTRARARDAHGWIMDTYLMRRDALGVGADEH